MVAGLQIFSADGSNAVQIDQDHLNFALKASGSKTLSLTVGGATALKYAPVTVTGATAPLVAIRPTSGTGFVHAIALYGTSVSGSTWTFNFIGPDGDTFDYFVFDKYTAIADATKVGLEVYNASGEVTYQSVDKPLRIVGVGPSVLGLDAARDYAAVQVNPSFSETYVYRDLGGGSWTYKSYVSSMLLGAGYTSMILTSKVFETYPSGSGTDRAAPGSSLIVCDVTNY